MKFKIGDRVKLIKNEANSDNKIGYIGYVVGRLADEAVLY
jgi:hypothetical protein